MSELAQNIASGTETEQETALFDLKNIKINHDLANCDACFFKQLCEKNGQARGDNALSENNNQTLNFKNNLTDLGAHSEIGALLENGTRPEEIITTFEKNLVSKADSENRNVPEANKTVNQSNSTQSIEQRQAQLDQKLAAKFKSKTGELTEAMQAKNSARAELAQFGPEFRGTKSSDFRLQYNSRGELDLINENGVGILAKFSDTAKEQSADQSGALTKTQYAEYIQKLADAHYVIIPLFNGRGEQIGGTIFEQNPDSSFSSSIFVAAEAKKSDEFKNLATAPESADQDQGGDAAAKEIDNIFSTATAPAKTQNTSRFAQPRERGELTTNDIIASGQNLITNISESESLQNNIPAEKSVGSNAFPFRLNASEMAQRSQNDILSSYGTSRSMEISGISLALTDKKTTNSSVQELITDIDVSKLQAQLFNEVFEAAQKNPGPANAKDAFELFGITLQSSAETPKFNRAETEHVAEITTSLIGASKKAANKPEVLNPLLPRNKMQVFAAEKPKRPNIPDDSPVFKINSANGETVIDSSHGISLPLVSTKKPEQTLVVQNISAEHQAPPLPENEKADVAYAQDIKSAPTEAAQTATGKLLVEKSYYHERLKTVFNDLNSAAVSSTMAEQIFQAVTSDLKNDGVAKPKLVTGRATESVFAVKKSDQIIDGALKRAGTDQTAEKNIASRIKQSSEDHAVPRAAAQRSSRLAELPVFKSTPNTAPKSHVAEQLNSSQNEQTGEKNSVTTGAKFRTRHKIDGFENAGPAAPFKNEPQPAIVQTETFNNATTPTVSNTAKQALREKLDQITKTRAALRTLRTAARTAEQASIREFIAAPLRRPAHDDDSAEEQSQQALKPRAYLNLQLQSAA